MGQRPYARLVAEARWSFVYFALASLSASSSQALARRITSSRAGRPFGKSVCRSWSRLTPPLRPSSEELVRPRVRVVCWRIDWARPVLRVAPPLRELARLPVRRFDSPTTPCARLRCAPSEAGRVNALPHSGQVSALSARLLFASLLVLPVAALRTLAIWLPLPFN